MSMSTSLADLNINNDITFDIEEDNNIDDLIKDVEKNLDDKKNLNKNNYLPLDFKEDLTNIKEEKENIDIKEVINKNVENKYNINTKMLNNFLILILFLIVNHPLLNSNIDNLLKIDNFYYKFIIKGIIFVILINLLKII
jgi:hypothetical protein